MRVAVLALQGGFAAHAQALAGIGHEPILLRDPAGLARALALVLPGGESTAQLVAIGRAGLWEPLDAFVRAGRPVAATCAGLILSARRVTGPEQRSFGWIDVAVARNGWGRQVESFEGRLEGHDVSVPFIRAPRVTEVGTGAEVLARFQGEPVLVRTRPETGRRIVGATFHPELAADPALHRWFYEELAFS